MNSISTFDVFTDVLNNRLLKSENAVAKYEVYSLEKVHAGLPVCDILEVTSEEKSQHDYILASLAFECDSVKEVDTREAKQTRVDSSCVIGSPLKLRDFQSELRFIPDKSPLRTVQKTNLNRLKPVSISEARRLVSLYNLSAQKWMKSKLNVDRSSWPALWVLCDGRDNEHTAFISTSVEISHRCDNNLRRFPAVSKHESSLANGVGTSDEHFTIRSLTVNVTGPLMEQCKPPSLASLIRNTALKQLPSAEYIAKYELIGKASQSAEGLTPLSDNVGLCQGSVEAAVHWDRRSALLDDPAVGASALLSIRTVSGDPRSSAYGLFNDICTLQGLISGLSDVEVKWSVVDSDLPLLARVKQLIEDQMLGDAVNIGKQKVNQPQSDEGPMPMTNHRLAEREDLDFTEHLWNVLRDCSSYSDLVLSLQHVVDCLAKGNLQPMVHKQNKTKLAEFVRDSYYGRLDPKVLSRVSPLELVVEIGFDKLFRDYADLFLSKELVTRNNLKGFLSNASEDDSFDSRWLRLEKLHRVLEMLVMLERYLMLPRPQLCSAVRQALQFYETHPLSNYDVFTLPIPAAVIWSLIKSCRPYLWKVNCVSYTAKHDKLQAAVAMTLSAPFPHFAFLESSQDLINDSKKYVGYFVTTMNQFSFDV